MIKNQKSIHLWVGMILILFVSFACRLPIGNDEPQPGEDLEATITVLQTDVAANQADQPHSLEDVQPTPEADQPTPEADPIVNQPYRGFVVFRDNQFYGYDFNGNSLGMQYPAGQQSYYGENEVSLLPDVIYYTQFGEGITGVYRVDASQTQQLDFIPSGNSPISIAVSPDGNKIAWSSAEWAEGAPETQLYIANMDGSDQRLVAELTAADQAEYWRVYHPLRWTDDGRLVYATGLTGIGGYMLFWGYNGMYQYDPTSGTNQTLVSDEERLGLCLSSVSHDLMMVAIVCGDGDAVVRVRQLNSGVETAFPLVEGQNLAGSAKFSSDDAWLAYVTQTQNYEDERGKVVVVPVDGSQAPRIVAEIDGGSFIVQGWLDADRFLVTRNEIETNNSTIWIMSKDGALVQELVSGNFVGLMP